MRIEINK